MSSSLPNLRRTSAHWRAKTWSFLQRWLRIPTIVVEVVSDPATMMKVNCDMISALDNFLKFSLFFKMGSGSPGVQFLNPSGA